MQRLHGPFLARSTIIPPERWNNRVARQAKTAQAMTDKLVRTSAAYAFNEKRRRTVNVFSILREIEYGWDVDGKQGYPRLPNLALLNVVGCRTVQCDGAW